MGRDMLQHRLYKDIRRVLRDVVGSRMPEVDVRQVELEFVVFKRQAVTA
jgi:hypothetical protein